MCNYRKILVYKNKQINNKNMGKPPYFWDNVWSAEEFKHELRLFLQFRPSKSIKYRIIRKFITKKKIMKPTIVSIGCGSSLDILYTSKKLHLKPYLLDISPEALKLSKENSERFKIDSVVKHGNILNIPLPSNFADIVYSGGVNEHFMGDDRLKTFDEMIRVAKSDGLIIIEVPHANSPIYRLGKYVREKIGTFKILEVPYSTKEVEKILSSISRKYTFEYEIIKESFLPSLVWLVPGRSYAVKKWFARVVNKRTLLDKYFGNALIVKIEKRK